MRTIFNGTVGRFFIIVLCIGVHLVFAVGMYFLGSFLGNLVLHDVRFGPEIFGILLATVMFVSAMITFVYHEYTREDLQAYELTPKGDGSFMNALTESQKIVAGFELSSLLFRCVMTLPNYFGAAVTAVLGILMLRFAYLLGKIIHAQTNRPVTVDAARLREEAGRKATKIGFKGIKNMGIDGLRRVWAGRPDPLDAPLDAKGQQLRDEQERAARRRKQQLDEQEDNERFAREFLTPKDTVSPNGHSPQSF